MESQSEAETSHKFEISSEEGSSSSCHCPECIAQGGDANSSLEGDAVVTISYQKFRILLDRDVIDSGNVTVTEDEHGLTITIKRDQKK